MPLFGPSDVEKLKAKRDVPGLIKALKYQKDLRFRPAAAGALGQIGDARAVKPLIAALKDRDMNVRRAAAGALGEIGAPAIGPLVAALGDRDGEAAAGALGEIGAPAVKPLIAALGSPDLSIGVRKTVAGALGQIGDARAVKPLIAALKDRDEDVRRAAAGALDRLAWSPDSTEAGAAYWAIRGEWGKCVQIGAPAIGPLIAALGDPDGEAAAGALGEIGAPAVKPLIAALESPDLSVRKTVAEELVALYRSGKLAPESRALVLAQRSIITEPVSREHSDGCYTASVYYVYGIGVKFPL